MTKLFTVAGVSTLNGKVKMRFANDLGKRVAILNRNGHSDVRLIELPEGMTKQNAALFLKTNDQFADVLPLVEAFLAKGE